MTAFLDQFKRQWTYDYEKVKPLTLETVTKEVMIEGRSATFAIGSSDGITVSGRADGGRIPVSRGTESQVTVTLKDDYAKVVHPAFNIFRTQAPLKDKMRRDVAIKLAQRQDSVIYEQLATTVNQLGANGQPGNTVVTANRDFIINANQVMNQALQNNYDRMITNIITPGVYKQMLKIDNFTSSDFIMEGDKPYTKGLMAFNYLGENYIIDATLPGAGTAAATCYKYEMSAIGYACSEPNIKADYYEPEDESYAWAGVFHAAEILLPNGVYRYVHDDTAA